MPTYHVNATIGVIADTEEQAIEAVRYHLNHLYCADDQPTVMLACKPRDTEPTPR